MAQAEVYKAMEKNKDKWLNTTQLSKITGTGSGSINANLNKLLKQGLVIVKEDKTYHLKKKWKWVK